MKNEIIVLVVLLLVTVSCGKTEDQTEKTVKAAANKESGNYLSKKWKKTKEIFIESDSAVMARKRKYYGDMYRKYSEFKPVEKWFASKPKELMGMKGEFYKMLGATVYNNKTVSHRDYSGQTEHNTYKYFFISADAYYIYDLSVTGDKVKFHELRRFAKAYGEAPMHDLRFNKKGQLTEEIYQGEFSQDLFTKDGQLFFEAEKADEKRTVTNTINLGVERNF